MFSGRYIIVVGSQYQVQVPRLFHRLFSRQMYIFHGDFMCTDRTFSGDVFSRLGFMAAVELAKML